MIRIAATFLLAALAALPATARTDPPDAKGEAELARLLAGRTAGPPRNCVALSELQSSQIIEGTAIVYRNGGTLYVNRPNGASILRRDVMPVSYPHGSQLCKLDIVQLFEQNTHMPRGSISMGSFVPYKKATPKP
jgi:hypothetical protein